MVKKGEGKSKREEKEFLGKGRGERGKEK